MNFFQANLREHITTEFGVGCGEGLGSGVQNGYFPSTIDPTKGQNMFEAGVCCFFLLHSERVTVYAVQSEVVVNDPLEPVAEWAIKRYQTWHEGMEIPEISPPPRLQVATSPEIPEDVEMEFAAEHIDAEEPHIDLIITGEVCDVEAPFIHTTTADCLFLSADGL